MIDIHNHSLFNIDDGSRSLEESLELLKAAAKQGVSDIILTPHFSLDGTYHMSKEMLEARVAELSNYASEHNIDINLHLGHELFIHRDLPECLYEGKCASLANSRYILVEFPFDEYQDTYDYILEDLRAMGYIIIIAHPERYRYVMNDVNFVLRWLDEGDLLQCNQSILLKKETEKLVKQMLDHHMISFIASDTHGNKRLSKMDEAYQTLVSMTSKEVADKLMYYNPLKILNNELIINEEYCEVKRRFKFFK